MKSYSDMTVDELSDEMGIWWHIVTCPKGPGTPSNDAREGALRLYQEAAAWRARRMNQG
jgi:hypothetical protein